MIIVQKFGGSSVADLEKIKSVANIIQNEVKNNNQIVVVVSAMLGKTDELFSMCKNIRPSIDKESMSEYDVVLATGEQITAGLLSLALQNIGISASSLMGWQIAITTDSNHTKARIDKLESINIITNLLKKQNVVICAGFQGISNENRITTLGRGGSDTSAIAIGVAINADRCDLYKDVDGIYTADPKICNKAKKIFNMSHEEILELSSTGSKILETRAVEMALRYNLDIRVRSTFDLENFGTLVSSKNENYGKNKISGISHTLNEIMVTISKIQDICRFSNYLFEQFLENNIGIDMIIQNEYQNEGKFNDFTFVINESEVDRMMVVLLKIKTIYNFFDVQLKSDIAKISIVGMKMINESGIASDVFKILLLHSINIFAVSTSDIKISLIIKADYTELAIRVLHDKFI